MRNVRLIARLDVKAPNLVKGIQLECLRKLGDPMILRAVIISKVSMKFSMKILLQVFMSAIAC